ncbi:MAG TPA: TfpX/TfpZ family type IV pilin accessory protein [Casimicrobiaceae bacterium]|nr:TfpX/TfpZ family type IV pilin accessory protein [Casimicrobiaceae bacterium]
MYLFAHENLARYTRLQAALIHLFVSALVAATIVAVMLLLWYPRPWFAAAGGGTLLLLLIGVDVVLGPFLTFVVFDPAKKSLAYDLAVIVMLQVAALIYGVHVMASARPAFIVYLRGAFEVVAAQDVDLRDIGKARLPEFQSVPLTGPRLAAARIPVDPGLQLQIAMEAATGGADFTVYPRFYIPYATASREAAARGEPLSKLSAARPGDADLVGKLVASSGKPIDGLVFLPLRTRLKEMAIVLTKAEGNVVGVLDVSPRPN